MAALLNAPTLDHLEAHAEHLAICLDILAAHEQRYLVVQLEAVWEVDHSTASGAGGVLSAHGQASSLKPAARDSPVRHNLNP